jgi:hypothetical protein
MLFGIVLYRPVDEGPIVLSVTRVFAISAIGSMLAALMSVHAGGARAASQVVVKPPPRVAARLPATQLPATQLPAAQRPAAQLPAVRPQQQLSLWGVQTNLQQYRDEWQPKLTPKDLRRRSEPPKLKSASRKRWSRSDR